MDCKRNCCSLSEREQQFDCLYSQIFSHKIVWQMFDCVDLSNLQYSFWWYSVWPFIAGFCRYLKYNGFQKCHWPQESQILAANVIQMLVVLSVQESGKGRDQAEIFVLVYCWWPAFSELREDGRRWENLCYFCVLCLISSCLSYDSRYGT